MWEIKDKSGVLDYQSIPIDRELTIGRDKNNDIIIEHLQVSRRHCKLIPQKDSLEIVDLNSTNGLFFNDKKVKRIYLKNGDNFKLGSVKFGVSYNEAEKPKQQVHIVNKKVKPNYILLAGVLVLFVVAGIFIYTKVLNTHSREELAPLQLTKVWTQTLVGGGKILATPVIEDINNDGHLDMTFADDKGNITCLDGEEGKLIFGVNDIAEPVDGSLSAGDITNDGKDEVVVVSKSGIAVVYNEKGKIVWRYSDVQTNGKSLNRPVLVDVSGDGIKDVLFTSTKKGLVALDGKHGWEMWNAKEIVKGVVISTPLVVDINQNGHKDFIINTINGHLIALAGDGKKVWKLWETSDLENVDYASPVLANVNGKKTIVVATKSSGVYSFDMANGNLLWIKKISDTFTNSPVVYDANGDGVDDIALFSSNGSLYLLDGRTGNKIWQTNLNRKIKSSPALFDVSKDGIKDIIIVDKDGNVLIIDGKNGQVLLEKKIPNTTNVIASPLIADLNNDGLPEVLISGGNGVVSAYTINRHASSKKVWTMYIGNNEHGE